MLGGNTELGLVNESSSSFFLLPLPPLYKVALLKIKEPKKEKNKKEEKLGYFCHTVCVLLHFGIKSSWMSHWKAKS